MNKFSQNIFLFLAFFLLGFSPGRTEIIGDLRFDRLGIDDGLSQSVVNCILQDSQGFMWFGTKDGLNRYDGYEFKIFSHENNNPNSLSHGYILSLCEDDSGYLWIGTHGGGLNKYNLRTEQFTVFRHEPENPNSICSDNISSILIDRKGNLWLGSYDNGISKYDRNNDKFTYYPCEFGSENKLRSYIILQIYEDKAGRIWVGSNKGLHYYNPSKDAFIYYRPEELKNPEDASMALTEDSSGKLLIGYFAEGVYSFDFNTGIFSKYCDKNGNNLQGILITNLIWDTQDNLLWAASNGGGLFKMSPGKDTYRYITENKNEFNISGNSFRSLYIDKNNMLWIGTNGYGINYLSPFGKRFTTYSKDVDSPHGLDFSSVRAIFEDSKGGLYIGGYGGIDYLDRSANTVEKVQYKFVDKYKYESHDIYYLSCTYSILPLGKGDNDQFWVGTEGAGLFIYNIENSTLTSLNRKLSDGSGFPKGMQIYSIQYDHNGILWFGSDSALHRYDYNLDRFKIYPLLDIDPSLKYTQLKVLIQDYTGLLWLGIDAGGIASFDIEKEKFTQYKHNPKDTKSLSNDRVYAIFEDSKDRLWIGTAGGGLNLFNRDAGTFTNYLEKDGLPNDVVNAILEDDDGMLWLSTNKGLSKFDPEKITFENYDVYDGLQSNEFNMNARLKLRDGDLVFGGIEGITIFTPENVKKNSIVPPVVILDFQVYNKSVQIGKSANPSVYLPEAINLSEFIQLSYKANVFSFEFSALNYILSLKNQYAYKMEGLEKDWNYVSSRRFATYSNIAPGKYTFRVKACNNDGIWNDEGAKIRIIITPPFWQTWWFRIISLIFVLSGIFGFLQWRTSSIRRQNILLEENVKIRTSELEEAMKNIKVLRGLIPICSSCKKIRNDEGFWFQLEEYISSHSDAEFSHGICPDCLEKLYPEYYAKIMNKNNII